MFERAVIISGGGALQLGRVLPDAVTAPMRRSTIPGPPSATHTFVSHDELKRRERDNILAALEHANGRIYGSGGAAELLALKPTTLASRK